MSERRVFAGVLLVGFTLLGGALFARMMEPARLRSLAAQDGLATAELVVREMR